MAQFMVVLAVVLILGSIGVPTLRGQIPAKPASGGGSMAAGITVLAVGDESAVTVAAVSNHLQRSLFVPVRVRSVPPPPAGSMDSQAAILAKQRTAADACLVALGAPELGWSRLNVYPDTRIALIGSGALEPVEEGEQAKRDAQWQARIRKESVHAVAMLMGVEPCVFPRCALFKHLNDGQLDFKANTPCPPCQKKCETALLRAGVRPQLAGPPR